MKINLVIDGCFLLTVVALSIIASVALFGALSWFLFTIGAIAR